MEITKLTISSIGAIATTLKMAISFVQLKSSGFMNGFDGLND